MLVRHLCYYLTDWNAIRARQEDYDTNKVVKCLKGKTINGYSNITIGGVSFHLQDSNKQQFLARLWTSCGQFLGGQLTEPTAIVPIPNRDGTVNAAASYRTLEFAQAIAAASSGKLVAVDALRWREAVEAAHKQKGLRTPERRYDNLVAIDCPKLPILLFDDVVTSGSSFVAANWRLAEAGNTPTEGIVVARRTSIQEEKMFVNEQRDLLIPARPWL